MSTIDFNHTVSALFKSLRPFAVRLTRDADDANDLMQDTMLKAFKNREKFAEGTNLKAWLYTIMKNTFISNYQRLVRRKTFTDSTDGLHYLNSSDNITENLAFSTFTREDIEAALAQTDAVFRVPFLMYFEGYKYHEIAEHLEIPIGTVKNRIHIARKFLKAKLSVYSSKN